MIADGDVREPSRLDEHEDGVFWGGQGRAIARLLIGIDPDAVGAMVDFDIEQPDALAIHNAVRNSQATPLVNSMMPILDVT